MACALQGTRDLALIKVGAPHEARSHVLELANVFRARVVDVAPESLTVEITGDEDKIDGLLEVLKPYGLLEVVRAVAAEAAPSEAEERLGLDHVDAGARQILAVPDRGRPDSRARPERGCSSGP